MDLTTLTTQIAFSISTQITTGTVLVKTTDFSILTIH
jgi:hypothetical protein